MNIQFVGSIARVEPNMKKGDRNIIIILSPTPIDHNDEGFLKSLYIHESTIINHNNYCFLLQV